MKGKGENDVWKRDDSFRKQEMLPWIVLMKTLFSTVTRVERIWRIVTNFHRGRCTNEKEETTKARNKSVTRKECGYIIDALCVMYSYTDG